MEIGIWGDSITYGKCDSEGLGWVGRLRKSLLANASVYNRGICGDTTDDLLSRFSSEADSIDPNLVVFAIGINDSKFLPGETENRIPMNRYKENMKELVAAARKHTDKIYLVGPTKVYKERVSKTGTNFINSEIRKYDNFLKELAETENFIYIPTFEILDTDNDLADGLHPNAQGYEKMSEVISKYIK